MGSIVSLEEKTLELKERGGEILVTKSTGCGNLMYVRFPIANNTCLNFSKNHKYSHHILIFEVTDLIAVISNDIYIYPSSHIEHLKYM